MRRNPGRGVSLMAGAVLALAAPQLQAQVSARPVLTVAGASVVVLRATRPPEKPPATPHGPPSFRPLSGSLRGAIATAAQASPVSGRLPAVGGASVVAIRATRAATPPQSTKSGQSAFRRLGPAARASIVQAAQVTTTSGPTGSPFLLTAWAPHADHGWINLHNVATESGIGAFATFGILGQPGSVDLILIPDGTSKTYVVDFQVITYFGGFSYRINSKVDGSTTLVPTAADGTTQDIVVVVSFSSPSSSGGSVLVFDTEQSHPYNLLGVEITPM